MAAAALMSAALVFGVQPMLARALLPRFGGTPTVWVVSLLFFQAALLAGYVYAHLVHSRGALRVHLGLLALSLLLLPLAPGTAPPPPDAPTLALLSQLALTAGVPYVLLSATAPLLQAHQRDRPYRLYAWSNAGSFGALAAYPLLVEPWLGTTAQLTAWSIGYGALVVVLVAVLWRARDAAHPQPLALPARRDALRWFALAACGTAALMTVSEAIAQDLSVTPLLWVLPLGLYLLSFVVCFGGAPRLPLPALVVALAAMWWVVSRGYAVSWQLQLTTWCAGLLALCVALHGELWRARPTAENLTAFYIQVAAGGAFGGLLVAVVAPLAIPLHLELHLTLVAAWLLCGWSWRDATHGPFAAREGRTAIVLGLAALLALGLGLDAWKRLRGADHRRSFYGVLKVKTYGTGDRQIVHLLDGRISHGFQYAAPERRREPTAYFVPHSGIGRVLSEGKRSVGVLGLGVGTLATYGRPGDRYRFYELNPDVADIARTRFTYLGDSTATVDVVLGDARLSLAAESPHRFDVLAVDAFSGDAIPTHLLTREAIALYLRHLAPDGVLATNVSNRHADLPRVVRAHAEHFGLHVRRVRAKSKSRLGPYLSDWLLLSRHALPHGEALEPGATVVWTDDHAPVLPILR